MEKAYIKGFGKLSALVGVLLYSTGFLIVNIHLSRIEAADFSLLRARYALVGFAFLIYLLAPALVFLPFLLAFLQRYNRRKSFVLRILFASLIAILMFYAIPEAVGLFVEPRSDTGFLAVAVRVWKLYYNKFSFFFLFLYIPGVLWLRNKFTNSRLLPKNLKHQHLIIGVVALVGFLSLFIPYIYEVYPQINSAVGGGQPKVINILPSVKVRAMLQSLVADPPINSAPKGMIGPFIMWYEMSESLVISPAPDGEIRPYVFTISKQEILSFEHVFANVLFESGYPTTIQNK